MLAFFLCRDRHHRLPVVGFSPGVVGMNSIAIYCMSQLMKPWIRQSCSFISGRQIFDGIYGPIVSATAVLFVLWLICYWLYRQKIFIRI